MKWAPGLYFPLDSWVFTLPVMFDVCLLLFWRRGPTYMDGKMTYPEFVWFLLSEEDKKHPRRLLKQ